ncbi:hypothetical protein LTR50_006285 [Elasticomyces elasticus]|nr:hypothetical protein LTR50_006285 [Elasticomyces elasticus]
MSPRPQVPGFGRRSPAPGFHLGELPPPQPPFAWGPGSDLPSPRAGEVPPALSPLDAFALHSRTLAKKLEERAQNGRRLSRLPHYEVAEELRKRPGYFRSVSGGSGRSDEAVIVDGCESSKDTMLKARNAGGLEVAAHDARPISHHPQLSCGTSDGFGRATPADQQWHGCEEENIVPMQDYFGINAPRVSSPGPLNSRQERRRQDSSGEARVPMKMPSLTSSVDSVLSSQPAPWTLTSESFHRRYEGGLAPPRSPALKGPRSTASIRSVMTDSAEDDASMYELASPPNRKFSYGSGKQQTPPSPFVLHDHRSPSLGSELSASGAHLPHPSFNFSRPLSSCGRPSFDTRYSFDARPSIGSRSSSDLPIRKISVGDCNTDRTALSNEEFPRRASEGEVFTPFTDESAPAPASMVGSESEYFAVHDGSHPAPSYIYAKYSLPRGRLLQQGSLGPRESWVNHQFAWEQPHPAPAPADTLVHHDRPASSVHSVRLSARPSCDLDVKLGGSARRSHSANGRASPRVSTQAWHKHTPSSPSIMSQSTERTVKPVPDPQRTVVELSPEEHLAKGIELHTDGSLSKSTYHLHLAAKAGLPLGMLLYALACRHGWGMRPSAAEGVVWLRKAVDSASLSLTSPDSAPKLDSPNASPFIVDKERKAQFALAVYELGNSYMNGWGVGKDRALALRCFEIAGSWGDADALAEAGFCYAKGVGCKKDVKKAAGLYRQAETKGMGMTGNRWIYKPKYMDADSKDTPATTASSAAAAQPEAQAKAVTNPPLRSRGRYLFSRRK